MRIQSLPSAIATNRRRHSEQASDRRMNASERRHSDRRAQSRNPNSQDRARHQYGYANAGLGNGQSPSPVFIAHIIGQQEAQFQQHFKSQAMIAGRAYDKALTPHLKPLHSRQA